MFWKKVRTNFMATGEHLDRKVLLSTKVLEGATKDDEHVPKRLSKSGVFFETEDYDGEIERLAAFAFTTGLRPVKYRKVFFDLHVLAEDAQGNQGLYKIDDWWYARLLNEKEEKIEVDLQTAIIKAIRVVS